MLFFILLIFSNPLWAYENPDTCDMAAATLHTFTGSLVQARADRALAFKKRQEIHNGRLIQQLQAVKAHKNRDAAIAGVEAKMFVSEPKFFTAYRSYQESNPCTDPKLLNGIGLARDEIKRQCANNTNAKKIIRINRHAWSSPAYVKEGIYIDSQCTPILNNGELYSIHQLANGFEASPERLCQAAWSGLKEVWSRAEVCQGRNGWYDIEEWSKGKIVKKKPPM